MRLPRVDKTIGLCENALNTKIAIGKEMENLLVQSVLMVIYAEFEKKFNELIKQRCELVRDRFANEFLTSRTARYPRGMNKGDIANCLGEFGRARKEEFNRCLDKNKKIESSYTSIISNRHLAAHGDGSKASFEDIKGFYEDSHEILDHFENAIKLEL